MQRPVIAAMLGACALLAFIVPPAAAEEGVTADTILFGQSAPLEGPASALGQGMRRGILSAFDSANRAGGIYGRMLKLVSRDDAYEPDRSIIQTRKLIEEDRSSP